ncbi:MAG: phenylalanine--tRNA ligase subunit alpha, partial [Gammaproteobacteria bacterium]|nr:phenylalanine--tRNA ligase subunit alpha [Gammaproteobacteria bacterium]
MQNLDAILKEAQAAFAGIDNPAELEQVKARYLGKSGVLTEQLKQLGKMPAEERREAG